MNDTNKGSIASDDVMVSHETLTKTIKKMKADNTDANIEIKFLNTEIKILKRRLHHHHKSISDLESKVISLIVGLVILGILIATLFIVEFRTAITADENKTAITQITSEKSDIQDQIDKVKSSLIDAGMQIACVIESDDKIFVASQPNDCKTFAEVEKLATSVNCSVATFTNDRDYSKLMAYLSTNDYDYMLGTYSMDGDWVNQNNESSNYISKNDIVNSFDCRGIVAYNGVSLKYTVFPETDKRPYIIEYIIK